MLFIPIFIRLRYFVFFCLLTPVRSLPLGRNDFLSVVRRRLRRTTSKRDKVSEKFDLQSREICFVSYDFRSMTTSSELMAASCKRRREFDQGVYEVQSRCISKKGAKQNDRFCLGKKFLPNDKTDFCTLDKTVRTALTCTTHSTTCLQKHASISRRYYSRYEMRTSALLTLLAFGFSNPSANFLDTPFLAFDATMRT